MNQTSSTYLNFHPEDAINQIPRLLSNCTEIEERDNGHTVIVRLSETPLDPQVLGRLTIINGKCRNQGMKLMLQCSDSIAGQLARFSLDRLIWVEPDRPIAL